MWGGEGAVEWHEGAVGLSDPCLTRVGPSQLAGSQAGASAVENALVILKEFYSSQARTGRKGRCTANSLVAILLAKFLFFSPGNPFQNK